MVTTVLYPEAMYPDDTLERDIFGPDVQILRRDTRELSELSDADCAATDGLMIFRQRVTATDMARFPRLRAIVRMGVGYDRLDRQEAARRGVMICNVPDYGTMEVADHAIALMLALRKGVVLYHDTQRARPPAPWTYIESPLKRRLGVQTFGVLGLGRIGTAAALRARAFGMHILFFDPYLPNGVDRALGIERAATLDDLLRRADVLSVHTPLTPLTSGMLGMAQLSLLPQDAVVINTARGPIIDIDALATLLRAGRISGVGLDVIPVEPPVEPVPELLRAYRAREPWQEGRLVITPHAGFINPEAALDIRVKSAETMRAALLGPAPQNVIRPEMF
jgi:C-terminal binding protein